MRSGIFYATIIIILVFVPLFALSGIEGRLFAPLGIAYIVSILASLLTSMTVTPVLAYYFLLGRQGTANGDSFLVRHLKAGNARLLQLGLQRDRRRSSLIVRSACSPPGIGAVLLPRAFLPPFNEGTLLVNLSVQPRHLAGRVEPARGDRRAADHGQCPR